VADQMDALDAFFQTRRAGWRRPLRLPCQPAPSFRNS
jgi:hypothetical protein